MERLSPADRRIAWDACLNVRDMGGLSAGDTTIRRGVLVRASALGTMTGAGRDAVRAYGIRTVIDLRSPEEVAVAPSPYADGARYQHRHFLHGTTMGLRRATRNGTMSEELRTLAEPDSGLAMIVGELADAEPGIVLHCVAGRDRTGFIIAVVLSAMGVPDQDVIADYAASDAELAEEYERFIGTHPADEADIREAVEHRELSMVTVLATIRRDHRDAASYLLAAGVTAPQLARLRAKLLV